MACTRSAYAEGSAYTERVRYEMIWEGRIMKPMPTTRLAQLVLVLTIGQLTPAVANTDDQPNVVVILADDLGWSDLGCYGSDLHETPHIDRFASQSVRFTDAYAMPVCSPTRAALLTGRWCMSGWRCR